MISGEGFDFLIILGAQYQRHSPLSGIFRVSSEWMYFISVAARSYRCRIKDSNSEMSNRFSVRRRASLGMRFPPKSTLVLSWVVWRCPE